MRELTEQEVVRREKAEKLREIGLDPFGQRYERDSFASDIKEKYKDIPHDEFENITVIIYLRVLILVILLVYMVKL